ncbi:DUF4851 domain-containing protein [Nitratidesulfovibrio sp. 1201_IL3209]|uniref:DUF4851 domain-containing protein n=1 Tax=Nitratidesulfovibrio sp. 1201_IL3209 TaxID=3084053 RepID=UPI002FD995EF
MPKLIAFVIVLLLAGFVYALMYRNPVRRGLAGDMLASSARPALLVRPAAGLAPAGAGVADIAPETASATGSARVYYALHAAPGRGGSGEPARLAALLAEASSEYRWPLDVSSGLTEVRTATGELAGMSLRAATFVLPPDRDALAPAFGDDPAPWRSGALVRRFTGLAEMRHVKMVVEYREPLGGAGEQGGEGAPRFGHPAVLDDPAALAAFEARAERAFQLERPGGDWARGRDITRLDAAPEQVKRREITRMLGILERDRGDDR